MVDPYASIAQHYDVMIDWTARITRERPFFTELLSARPHGRVLDIGCATGHHSRLFAELGAVVTGIDPSEAMLERARALTPGDNPRFLPGGFAAIPGLRERFDLITVVGNTLAHVDDGRRLLDALRNMHHALTPGGRICLQVINYDRLQMMGTHWLPLVQRTQDETEFLFLREHRAQGKKAEFNLITLVRHGESWEQTIEHDTHLALTSEVLSRGLQQAGFRNFDLYGDYQRTPFDPATSPGLVAVTAG